MKVDLKREIATYRAPEGSFDLVTVPTMRFLMIDGHGDPNTAPAYERALRTIYPFAYALKFLSKNTLGRDYVVPPLEALWWADDLDAFTSARDKSRWSWTVMIAVPDWIEPDQLNAARETAGRKVDPAALGTVRVEPLDEGLCVQTLHVGSYDDEGPVLARMHTEVIADRSLRMTGKHHEIYLSDPRRTRPEKLRTILRQPVRAADPG